MRIVPGLHMGERTRGGRVYLLDDGGLSCVLVDTGAPDGTLGAGALLQEAGRRPHEVRLVVLTHAHAGHAGNAAGMRLLTGAPLAASAAVAEALAAPPPPPRRRLPWVAPEAVEAARVDRILAPGEVVDLAGGVEVLDAPGHAPGALAFRLLAIDALCVGDAATLSAQGVQPPPARRCADAAEAERTARWLGSLGARVVCPGHGLPSVEGRLPARSHR